MNIEKTVYVCHQFGGKPENVENVKNLVIKLRKKHPNYNFISPLHALGYLWGECSWEVGMDYCIDLLSRCDEMWTFGSKSMSKGCMIEKDYCKANNKPHLEKGEIA